MTDLRKKISKTDSLITWNIDGEMVTKTFDERLKEVRFQAQEKTREGDFIHPSGYTKKVDGSIQASARVEPKKNESGITRMKQLEKLTGESDKDKNWAEETRKSIFFIFLFKEIVILTECVQRNANGKRLYLNLPLSGMSG